MTSARCRAHEIEIIEIGAVLVDGHTLRTVAELMTFVRPTLHPVTPFCTQLTTITQDDVDAAPAFRRSRRATRGVRTRRAVLLVGRLRSKPARRRLRRDTAIDPPLPGPHWNLKDAFRRARGSQRRFGANGALEALGLTPTGTHHRGIDDARNIARTLPYVLGRSLVAEVA